jgi:hypothetical protein
MTYHINDYPQGPYEKVQIISSNEMINAKVSYERTISSQFQRFKGASTLSSQ